MRLRSLPWLLVGVFFALALAGCAQAAAFSSGTGTVPVGTVRSTQESSCATPQTQPVICGVKTLGTSIPAVSGPQPADGPQQSTPVATGPVVTPTPGPFHAVFASATPLTVSGQPRATPCTAEQCALTGSLFLSYPSRDPDAQAIDPTYRFGTTQGGMREPHHGGEIPAAFGSQVLAAADGVVEFAGSDDKQMFGPWFAFYGNLVVLRHDLPAERAASIPEFSPPLYTLYGHLSKVLVQSGQPVKAGQPIGEVGMSGVATGVHLHFEVRLGEHTYKESRNPELWLVPRTGADGQPGGALAGRIQDPSGHPVKVDEIVVEHLPGPGGRSDWQTVLQTYQEKILLEQPPFREDFAVGDLPPGWYRITFAALGLHKMEVQILPRQVTFVNFLVGGKN